VALIDKATDNSDHVSSSGLFGDNYRVARSVRFVSASSVPPYPANRDGWSYRSRAGQAARPDDRFGAFFLDLVICSAPVIVVVLYGMGEAFQSYQVQRDDGSWQTIGDPGSTYDKVLLIVFLANLLLAILVYPLCFIAARGATIGMQIVNIKVVDAATRERVAFRQVVVRQTLFSLCPPLLALTVLLDRSDLHRGWHDRAARDVVIRTR
jgi:uncharacterized RDD family membrane protein YckC